MALYQEKFEQRFLAETSDFYNQQARKFLESGDVGNYMTQVLTVLRDEECRAFEFLDRLKVLKNTCRKSCEIFEWKNIIFNSSIQKKIFI